MSEAAHPRPAPPRTFPWKQLALAVLALALVAAVAATTAGYIWLRAYTPSIRLAGTAGPGPGTLEVRAPAADDPAFEGIDLVVSGDRPGSFSVLFDVTNDGRLPITFEGLVDGTAGGGDSLFPQAKLHGGFQPGDESLPPFSPLTLGSGETAFLGLEIVVAPDTCDHYAPGSFIVSDSVSLRYSYARSFERETTIPLPMRTALVC